MPASPYASRHVAMQAVKQQELLRLLLTGATLREAAAVMKINYATARTYGRTPEFLLMIKEHSGEIAKRMVEELSTSQLEFAQRLEEASERALDEMMAIIDNEQVGPGLKYKVAQDLLDRDIRASKTKKLDVKGSLDHSFINPAVLIHAAATAKELEAHLALKGALPSGDNGTITTDPANS